MVEETAAKIVSMGLAAPAVFMLEAHKPLAGLVSSCLLLGEPLAKPILGSKRVESLKEFFSDKENIEELILAIETQAQNTRAEAHTNKVRGSAS
jgi:hypothetical protein